VVGIGESRPGLDDGIGIAGKCAGSTMLKG